MQKITARLDSLTSLRFIAVTLIVFHHTREHWKVTGSFVDSLALGHGVSFFFVLSGFVLTYVYRGFDSIGDVKRFYMARLARIWPIHLIMFALFILLIKHQNWNLLVMFSNVSLIQAWIPINYYYFSYNGPAWAVSAEVFFYLFFSLTVSRWKTTWCWITLSCAVFTMAWIMLVNALHLPQFAYDYLGPTTHALVYINPLSRLFEFVLGMATAQIWITRKAVLPGSTTVWTLAELAVSGVATASICFSSRATSFLSLHIGPAGVEWYSHSGSCLAYAAVILVFAVGKGWVSRLMSARVLTLFGETSYCIFMVHVFVFKLWTQTWPEASSGLLSYGIYWLLVTGSAYLLWRFAETPLRNLVLRRSRSAG